MYQGHHSDGSGIQRHNAGGLYPYVIQFRGNDFTPELIHPTGQVTQHATYDEACATARKLLDLAPAAKLAGQLGSNLVHLVCSPVTARDYAVLGIVEGTARLIKSFGQRSARADLAFK